MLDISKQELAWRWSVSGEAEAAVVSLSSQEARVEMRSRRGQHQECRARRLREEQETAVAEPGGRRCPEVRPHV